MSVSANWRISDPLHFAWFAYADADLRQRYRDSGIEHKAAAIALQFEMRMELRERIGNEEFLALAVPIDIDSDRQPAIVPAAFFASDSVNILWDDNSMSGLGQSFSEVRICIPSATTTLIEAPAIGVADVAEMAEIQSPAEKRGGGRSDLYSRAKPILAQLFSNPALAAMTANPLLDPFNRVYVEAHSTPERRAAAISERSLRSYIKRYRQELANIGSDDFAN